MIVTDNKTIDNCDTSLHIHWKNIFPQIDFTNNFPFKSNWKWNVGQL